MLIYEVNLQIDYEIYNDYIVWLKTHIQQILNLPGFIKALLLNEQNVTNENLTKNVTVQYHLESQEHLDDYLTKHAAKMRNDGLTKFNQKFTAKRRVFIVYETFVSTNTNSNSQP